jgi:glycosyltransferase involved in cell wall biosynthesis
MRIAFFHNRYRERGGEDAAVAAQMELLAKAGHEVSLYEVGNRDAIRGPVSALRAARGARWNPDTAARVEAFLADHPCDVAHVHNFFPLLSPSLHHALSARGLPVVQTLHNYRLVCANAMLMRRDRPCEECVSRGPWNAVRYGCYRGSRLQTAVWADMTAHHRRLGTWHECVDLFTTPSDFARRKLLAAGLPPERVEVLPNPVADPEPAGAPGRGGVYVGRLAAEKGVDLLIEAWRRLPAEPLVIVGGGPEEARLHRLAADLPSVCFTGEVAPDAARAAIAAGAFLVVPSRWYEVFPTVALEAFAAGRPVIASAPGALAEVIEPGRTGLLFDSGGVAQLAEACRALALHPERARAMGDEARAEYEARYAPERTLARMASLYARALRRRQS